MKTLSLPSLVAVLAVSTFTACGQNPTGADIEAVPTSTATAKLTSGQNYRITSVRSGLALDVIGVSTQPGAHIQQWPYWKGANQQWQLKPNADGSYQIVSVNSGLCLDVIGISKNQGAQLQQWGCWGGANQAWKLVNAGNGAFQLVSVNSGLAVDVTGGSSDGGALIQQWPYAATTNQQWYIQPLDSSGNATGGTAPGGPAGAPTPTPSSQPHASVGCGRPRGQVTLGGVQGVDAMVDPQNTAQFRACGGSLYIHQVGWASLNDQQKRQVVANFAGTGPVHLEMAEPTDLVGEYGKYGINSISIINVNSPGCSVPPDDDTVAGWTGWVNHYKTVNMGFKIGQYNDTPNCPPPGNLDWSSPVWNDSRARALAGGGIVLDAPPSQYEQVLADHDAYKAFIKAEVAWANANGLHSTIIISAIHPPYDFVADTKAMIAEFNALPPNQRPQEYACENYGAGALVGSENDAGSVANMALWIINNASTYVP